MKKEISIIIPVYNEEKNIPIIWSEIVRVFGALEYGYELIFVDDGSRDESVAVVKNLIAKDKHVNLIELSRNFGKEMATSAGLHEANGAAALVIDADLQHPPHLIPDFISKWEAGADMVIGIRRKNNGAGIIKSFSSKIFRSSMMLIGEKYFKADATDFRLIDRKVVNEFKRFTERSRMTRGLLDWLGFKKDYVYFVAEERRNGKANYSALKLLKLAMSAFVSHSLFPLKLAGYLGIMIILFSGPLGLFIFFDKYIFNNYSGFYFSGPAILAVINLFLIGIVLSCLGLIALYIATIQIEVINRPMYIVSNRMNGSKRKRKI